MKIYIINAKKKMICIYNIRIQQLYENISNGIKIYIELYEQIKNKFNLIIIIYIYIYNEIINYKNEIAKYNVNSVFFSQNEKIEKKIFNN